MSYDTLRLLAAAVILWLAVENLLNFAYNIDIFYFWIAVLANQREQMFAFSKNTASKLLELAIAVALSFFAIVTCHSILASPAVLRYATGQWGFVLPLGSLLVQAVWLSMSFASIYDWFGTLVSNSWPRRPFIVMMAGNEKANELQHVRIIRATSGLALDEDLDAWKQSAFQMLSNNRGNMHEALLIQAF
jgi:hypothetical protein